MTARQRSARYVLATLAAIAGGVTAHAAETPLSDLPEAVAYEQCMSLARSDPDAGFEAAIAWRDAVGGAPAQHCTAVALAELGHFADAAERLEQLAETMTGFGPAARAAVVGQAGQAWWQAGETLRAHAAITAALELDPQNPDLLVTRSEVLASAANYWEAIDDLNLALELDPTRVDAFIFRATAYRFVDALELASEDLERALALDRNNPNALLERGIVRRLGGDDAGARDDWLYVLRAAPESVAAEVARANIERLDVAPQ